MIFVFIIEESTMTFKSKHKNTEINFQLLNLNMYLLLNKMFGNHQESAMN